jgi:class 3 adenylate cyclase
MDKFDGSLLVVDDSEMNRDMLTRRLVRRGYTVAAAENGRQALAMIASQPFDLVVLDIMMPGLSGLQVLEDLRRRHAPSELPVIMATAKDQSEDIVLALKLGANDYVTKPLDFPVVLARVQTQLSLKRAMQDIQMLAEQLEQRNRFIRDTFGQYVSDEIVANLLASPTALELGGEWRKVTLLYSDLRGFTAMSEELEPDEVVTLLNRYLGVMIDIIQQHRGTIEAFTADAIYVVFGVPAAEADDAERAVACAMAMQLAMVSLNQSLREDGLPAVEMGIGIHTGEVVVGNFGSERRKKYGVIGSHANLAGRIESYTVGGQVLISKETYLEVASLAQVGEPMEVVAKGIATPVQVYDMKGLGEPYNLRLPVPDDRLRTLEEAVPLQYTVLVGKHLSNAMHRGRLVKLSANAGEVHADTPVASMDDLRMELTASQNSETAGHIYGKVVDVLTGPEAGFRVHFTSIPPGVALFFQKMLATQH